MDGNRLIKQVQDSLVDLARKTEEKRGSAEIQRYLDFMAKFYRYSLHNTFLIWMNKPNATLVKGFRQWNDVGRYVKKGEHGLPILAPMFKKVVVKKVNEEGEEDEEEKKILAYFSVVYVFDVSQTEGNPLPIPEIALAEGKPILDKLVVFAKQRGISVSYSEMHGSKHGTSSGKAIDLDTRIDEVRQSAVAIHELAHELLHRQEEAKELTREDVETEAETVAYTVAKHFGIMVNSEVYLSIWQPEPKKILETFKRIHKVIVEIVEGVEEQEQEEQDLRPISIEGKTWSGT